MVSVTVYYVPREIEENQPLYSSSSSSSSSVVCFETIVIQMDKQSYTLLLHCTWYVYCDEIILFEFLIFTLGKSMYS